MSLPDKYWATTKEIVPILRDKRKQFFEFVEESGVYQRVLRALDAYHTVIGGSGSLTEGIQFSGDAGEEVNTSLNLLRSSLVLLRTYVASGKIEFDAMANDSTAKTLLSTRRVNEILDAHVLDPATGLEDSLGRGVEDALVTGAGYNWSFWNRGQGDDDVADVAENIIYRHGSLNFLTPLFTDVVFDHTFSFEDSPWILARRRSNVYDLIALYPKKKAELLAAAALVDEAREYDLRIADRPKKDADTVWHYYFWLKPSPAASTGRYVEFVGNDVLEDHDVLPDGHVPIHRLIPDRFLTTAFGYAPSFVMQPAQDLLNAAVSSVATNQNALGSAKVWLRAGEPITRGHLEPGVKAIRSESPPQALNLYSNNPELFQAVQLYTSAIERLSGVNAISAGVSDSSSGAARAFTEQRTQQAASELISAYDRFISLIGGSIVKCYRKRLKEGATRFVYGTNPVKFQGTDLDGIDRVAVVRGNPSLRTINGRVAVGQQLAQMGLVDNDNLLTLIMTGSLDALTKSRDGQAQIIEAEGDALLSGENKHVALPTDNHILHIRQHAALASNPVVRNDPVALQSIAAAILQHQQLMLDPAVAMLQSLLYAPVAPGPQPGQPSPPRPPEGKDGQAQLKIEAGSGESAQTDAATQAAQPPT